MPEKLIRRYTRQLLLALECLQKEGIIHHDMKAGNVLLTNNGQSVCIADFGEALESAADGSYPSLNRCGIIGTMFHHAPEIFRYHRKFIETYDEKVDVWALGMYIQNSRKSARSHFI